MSVQPLPAVRACELDTGADRPDWLVDSLWTTHAVGVIGGPPKACKSWLALDIALSVATRSPCLDTFAVSDSGPVLVYMAEDAMPVVRARLLSLCSHRGLSLDTTPLYVITVDRLRLDRGQDRNRLRETVRQLRPRLLLLDPFVRLHNVDENDAGQVSALLAYLRELQRQFDTAVVVVHHARKNAGGHGQALRGSGDFHAWGDSNLYLHRRGDCLRLSVEHRCAPSPGSLGLELVISDDTGPWLAVDASQSGAVGATDPAPDDLHEAVVSALAAEAAPLTRTALRARLSVRNERLGRVLGELETCGRLQRIGRGWAVPVPEP